MSKKIEDVFISTSVQRVLCFLINYQEKELYDSEIQRAIPSISKASVNNALRHLYSSNLTTRLKKGKISVNKLKDLPELKLFKQMINVIKAKKILLPTFRFIDQAILYGSCAKGENDSTSDMDIFIISDDPIKVRSLLFANKKLQIIIKKKSELIRFRKDNEEFYQEITKGIKIVDKYEKVIC